MRQSSLVANQMLDMLIVLARTSNTLREINFAHFHLLPNGLDKQVMRELFECAPNLKSLAVTGMYSMNADSREQLIESITEFLSSKVDASGKVKVYDT